MANIMHNVQTKIKTSSSSLFTFIMKVVSGLLLGLTIALIFQEIIGYSTLSFSLIASVIFLGFLRAARNWSLVSVLIFDLVCVLIGLLLRMYILVAPGA